MSTLSNTISLDGILLVDKPKGPTSHDVVDRLRRKLKMKKIGHAGTLDPNATGLLIMLLGKATKVSQYLMSLDKEYIGRLEFGKETNTYDAEGDVMVERPIPEGFNAEGLNEVLATFMGDQYQTPPMFSAKKVDGVPLYKLARKGKEIEREPRFIHISTLQTRSFELPYADVFVRCSKGTYIRSLAHDIGEKVGCGAYLAELRRTASDRFSIDDAVTLEKIEEMSLIEIRRRLIPIYQAVPSHVL